LYLAAGKEVKKKRTRCSLLVRMEAEGTTKSVLGKKGGSKKSKEKKRRYRHLRGQKKKREKKRRKEEKKRFPGTREKGIRKREKGAHDGVFFAANEGTATSRKRNRRVVVKGEGRPFFLSTLPEGRKKPPPWSRALEEGKDSRIN